jgi:hypothetical protein
MPSIVKKSDIPSNIEKVHRRSSQGITWQGYLQWFAHEMKQYILTLLITPLLASNVSWISLLCNQAPKQ